MRSLVHSKLQMQRCVTAAWLLFTWAVVVEAKVPLKLNRQANNLAASPLYMDTYKPLGDQPQTNPPGTIALCAASETNGCLAFPACDYCDTKLGFLDEIGTPQQQWLYTHRGLIQQSVGSNRFPPRCLGPHTEDGAAKDHTENKALAGNSHYELSLQECPDDGDNDENKNRHMRFLVQSNGLVRSLAPVLDISTGTDISMTNPYCMAVDLANLHVGLKPCDKNDPYQHLIVFGTTEPFLLFLEDRKGNGDDDDGNDSIRLAYHLGSRLDGSSQSDGVTGYDYNPRILVSFYHKLLFTSEPIHDAEDEEDNDDDNSAFFGDVLAFAMGHSKPAGAYYAKFDKRLDDSEPEPAIASLYFRIPPLVDEDRSIYYGSSSSSSNKDEQEVINMTNSDSASDLGRLTWKNKNLRIVVGVLVGGCLLVGIVAFLLGCIYRKKETTTILVKNNPKKSCRDDTDVPANNVVGDPESSFDEPPTERMDDILVDEFQDEFI